MPTDLFTANASAALASAHALRHGRARTVRTGPAENGGSFGLMNGVGPAGAKYVPGSHYRVDVMASTGLYDDGKKGIRRPTDPELRVKDMDRDGVDAEVIYGILGAATRLNDHEAANEMFQHLQRLAGGLLPPLSRPLHRAGLPALRRHRRRGEGDLSRGRSSGSAGMELSCSWDMEPMWHPVWEPLWKAVNDVNLPLHFHTFPAMPPGELDTADRAARAARRSSPSCPASR